MEVLLGARSLDDVVSRLDAIERVSGLDARILREVKQFKREVETSRERLREARSDQARIVAEQAAQKAAIEAHMAEREQMLASVQDEIQQLQAEERRRAAEAAAQARARLAAQQAAAQAATTYIDPYSEPAFTDIPTGAPLPDGSRASQVVAIALQYLGIPYVWGGSSPRRDSTAPASSATCTPRSGSDPPHHAASMFNHGTPVAYSELHPVTSSSSTAWATWACTSAAASCRRAAHR